MRLHDLKPRHGARHRRKRVGHGPGSHRGKTSTRGTKGQKARTGANIRPGFEGGQMPLARRMPKRGFNNARFRREWLPVNLRDLEAKFAAGARVDETALREAGLANGHCAGIKILGTGKLTKAITVIASAFSASARKAIEAAGGSCETLGAPHAAATGQPEPTAGGPSA